MANIVTPKEHFHGSDLEKIEAFYGIKKEDIVSFSANVNPLGLSQKVCEQLKDNLSVISRYPDREYTALRKSIGNYCGTDYQNIIVGNGSTELISAVIKLVRPANACLLAPTYSEYGKELTEAGSVCHEYMLLPSNDFLPNLADLFGFMEEKAVKMLVICNPNNPTSVSMDCNLLSQILTFCEAHDIFVMIDETYVEFSPEYEQITAVSLLDRFKNFIILRGISKFFAAPGLRLGYGLSGNHELLARVNSMKNPWSINSVAEFVGQSLFEDTDFIKKTKTLIATERDRVCERLAQIEGLHVYPPTANFVLVRIMKKSINADLLFDAAIKKGLMIRNCASFDGLSDEYFRLCFMLPEDNDRLLAVIEEVMK